jgi:succinate dehydrogenase / fumarate reductase, cytochrome b subunit
MNKTSIAQKGFFAYLIGKKTLMALTGLFLTLFLIVHVSGNLQLFNNDNGKAFNEYSVFMTTFPPVKAISYLLYISIIAHAIDALILTLANKKARPKGYAVNNPSKNSSWSSRNMGLLGTVLLFFLIIHMTDFWYEYKFGDTPYKEYTTDISTGETTAKPYDGAIDGKMQEYVIDGQTKVVIVKDLYAEVAEAFNNPLIAIIYVICMISVAFHMHHGFQSSFQTLGINHPKYTPLIKKTGTLVFAIIIPALFAAMPLYFLIN